MARGGKKEGSAAAVDPITEERTRLKKLSFSRHILSQNPSKLGPSTALGPSKTVMKHHGKDILRKSQRKNRYLFSFPGLLGPISGGKIGDLKDLGTKNPVLYLDFPQGQMKLFGTIVYPKNRYLTLQFSKGGKNVTCDDYFDNVIVFSDAWWIGTKDENPEELQLQFPNKLNLEKHIGYDFKGGIGATCDSKAVSGKSAMQFLEPESPKVDLKDHLIESPTDVKKLVEVTPSRHSARTAGKKFNFAEGSSGDDIVANGDETSDEYEEKDIKVQRKYHSKTSLFTESSSPVVFDVDSDDAVKHNTALEQKKQTAKSQDLSTTSRSSLVQTTLSTLFKKVEEKGRKSNEPADRKFASQSSDPNDSYQDMDASDKDWTG